MPAISRFGIFDHILIQRYQLRDTIGAVLA
jgi:hypothetical protein